MPEDELPPLDALGVEGSLLDLVDHLLNQGVVLRAEVVLGLASIDLIYLRLTALLCAADRVGATAASARDRTVEADAP